MSGLGCDKCGRPVEPGNDAVRLEALAAGSRVKELGLAMFQSGTRHLFPLIENGARVCDGSPSRAQYFAGEPRDPRYTYVQDRESALRRGLLRLLLLDPREGLFRPECVELQEGDKVRYFPYRTASPAGQFLVHWQRCSENDPIGKIHKQLVAACGRKREDNHELFLLQLLSGEKLAFYFSDGHVSVSTDFTIKP